MAAPARRRRKLRFRVMATLAGGGLLVAAGVSAATYGLSSRYLLAQREASAVRQTQANARLVRSLLRSPNPDIARLLGSLDTPGSGGSVVHFDGEWFAASAGAGPDLIPRELRTLVVERGLPGRQRAHRDGRPVVGVGIPLGHGDAYFEAFPLEELARTLRTIQYSLIAACALSLAGSLAVGYWASRRVLRPVADIGRAAAAIAAGRLDARLDAAGDDELVALATGFNSMVDSLQDRIERDARFASDVSHELRSPLTTLRSAVEIMAGRRDRLDARTARALDLLAQEVERFEALVQDLLEISRYDAGVATLDMEPTDLRRLLADALEEAGTDGVSVRFEGENPVQAVDRRRLQQSVRNLVRNAETHGGGVVAAAVHIGVDSIVVSVEDRGPGVPFADREAIFRRFFRGGVAGRRSSDHGVGLGLALVQEHVHLQGGQVWVEDSSPAGARFVVQLPKRSQ